MPVLPRRAAASSLPTLLSITKLIQAIPRSGTFKRSSEWAVTLAEKPIEPEDPPDSPVFWWKLGLSVVLVLAGGVFAGLTLALMGSDDLNLRVLSTSSDDPKERKAATKVLRLLGRGRHWVLVVLLLGNVIVNESLPIFLDDVLGGGLAAVVVSTTMIVIFGEIIPQAVCVRYGLSIGGVCAPLVLGLMIIFAPIAWPVAKLLDYVLGSESGNTYKKAELKSFLQFHREGEEPLRDDEIGILNGVLSLNDKEAKEIMTPIKDCLILPADKILDHEAIDQILLSGFSRIPIHEAGQRDNFIGMLLVKRLITYSPEDEWPVSKFPLLPLPEARPDINCFQALDYFQTGRAHLLLISETPGRRGGAIGIVSLEDLIEEIIGEEIVDETDRYQDNRSHKVAKRAGTAAVMRGIIERQRVITALSRKPSRQGTIDLAPGMSKTNSSQGNEGLLIQIHDGNMVAEPVAVADVPESGVAKDERRIVVSPPSHMDAIEEATSDAGRSPLIAPHGENGVKREGVEAEVAGEITEGGQGEGDGSKLHVPDGKDLLGPLDDDRREEVDELAVTGVLAYPTYGEFKRAAKAFTGKYTDARGDDVGPGRTNKGWEWKESQHKWSKGDGYLYRRVTRHVKMSRDEKEVAEVDQVETNHGLEDEEETAAGKTDEPTETTSLLGAERTNSNTNGSGTGKLSKSQKKKKAKKAKQRQTPTPPSEPQGTPKATSSDENGKVEHVEKIEVEHHIIYSKTYHVPQLLTRAWNSTGAPLSLDELLKYRIVHSGAHLPDGGMPDRADALMLDPHSPFPLLQQLDHPITGEVVWSVHPCQVGQAVEEVLAGEKGDTNSAESQEHGENDGGKAQEQQRSSVEERQLKWLETWMMLSSGVVDLTA